MEQQTRQTAYKIWISDLRNKEVQKETGEWSPSYISIDNKKVSRVNIIATVVMKYVSEDKAYATLTIDDSSSDIQIKAWREDVGLLDEVDIGDTILFIGKIREYNSQLYLNPEIIKALDKTEWLDLRKKELELQYGTRSPTTQTPETRVKPKEKPKPEEIKIYEEEISTSNDRQKILNTIEDLDRDGGADILEVISSCGIDEESAQLTIRELLKEGEIFEIKSGKLKIIE